MIDFKRFRINKELIEKLNEILRRKREENTTTTTTVNEE